MGDCRSCKKSYVCKYVEEYERVKTISSSKEFEHMFYIACQEYDEAEVLMFDRVDRR